MKVRVRIDSKTARKVFNGDFDSVPLEIINNKGKYITKQDMKEIYSRSEYIKKVDFKGLLKMEIRAKKIEPFISEKNLYSTFIMEKIEGKWYIRVANHFLGSYAQERTLFTFTDETFDDIVDREKEEEE